MKDSSMLDVLFLELLKLLPIFDSNPCIKLNIYPTSPHIKDSNFYSDYRRPFSPFRFMTQDERWLARYNEVMDFMETNHRNPSRHRIEEQLLLNFIKHNRKLLNAGELKEPRLSLFKDFLALSEKYRGKN